MAGNPQPGHNQLLGALPAEDLRRLSPHLTLIRLRLGRVLYEPGDTLRCVYFPTDSIVSLLYIMENGSSGEISVVGNEGVVGVSLFMGGQSTSSRAIVQSAGYAYRMPARRIKDEFNRHGRMMMMLLRYTQSLMTQMTQTAACNRHHSIDEQLARWLLLSMDRLPSNKMKMTQQLVANMLSVTRPRVTEVAGKLVELGVIRYSSGKIEVVDRPMLEKLSCECYSVVKAETDRLLPRRPAGRARRALCASANRSSARD